jgi:LysR family transcriptional regulator, carnitine catabolism transcriptional activator
MVADRGITVHELRAFALVAKLQSFTRAAEVLRLSQPGLSMAVRQLEAKLDTTLFDRGRKAVQLSPVGIALLPSVDKLVESFDRTIAGMVEVSEGKIGRIAIACPEGVAAQLIAPALKEFVDENPRVIVSLFDGDATTVEHMMHARVADFGLTGFWVAHPDFEFEPIATDRCCVICPAQHPFYRKRTISIEDLDGVPIVSLNRDAGIRRLIEREAVANGVRLNIRFEVARVSTLIEMVASNECLSILTELSRPHHTAAQMKAIPLSGRQFSYPVGIVTPSRRMLTAAANSFIETLRTHVAMRAS